MSSGQALVLAIDQGTTSSRVMAFDADGAVRAQAQRELPQIYPGDGLVEHDPEAVWEGVLDCLREVLDTVRDAPLAAMGITNQRETALAWDKATGRAFHNAIVWQDRRGEAACRELARRGLDGMIQARTGLLPDSYFSATKFAWLLENAPGCREAAQDGRLALGTVDAFLLWRLTGGTVFATDATNASRTMLFDIHRQEWDAELLDLFAIPAAALPRVVDCAGALGACEESLLGRALTVTGMAGDQQAAMAGQACFAEGMVKSTFGTGCFALINTGAKPVGSRNRLLATVAYRLAGRTTYALEGSIFNAGTVVQWLRDRLGLIGQAAESERLAAGLSGNGGVYLVPAFTGLGAPHWDALARGAVFGLTRDTGVGEIVRAGLESVCYQMVDLIEAMAADGVPRPQGIRVDGGMAANRWMLQFLADVTGLVVERPAQLETTALGAARLAALGAGLLGGDGADALEGLMRDWRAAERFTPRMDTHQRAELLEGWRLAVARTRLHAPKAP